MSDRDAHIHAMKAKAFNDAFSDCTTPYTTTTGTYYEPNAKLNITYPPEWSAWIGLIDNHDPGIPKFKLKGVPMQTLFNIIVVSKDKDILIDTKVVAEDAEEAKFSVDIHSVLKEKGLKPKDVTILCEDIGEVKVWKEVQKVKVVEKDEE